MAIQTFINYLLFEKRSSKHTIAAYRNDLDQFNAFLTSLPHQPPIKIAEYGDIRNWIIEMVTDGKDAKTINRKIASLRSYYKFLIQRSEIKTSPVLRIKPLKTSKSLPSFINENEMIKILDTFPYQDDFTSVRGRLVIELLYGTGIRLNELIHLKEHSIDREKQQIKVLGKRSKERIIPVSKYLLQLIEDYCSKKSKNFTDNENPYLIVTNKGKSSYPMMIYRIVQRALVSIISTNKKSPHLLRHTFATHLLDKGADLNAVKELLGHANLAATQVYTHNSMEKIKKTYQQAHPKA